MVLIGLGTLGACSPNNQSNPTVQAATTSSIVDFGTFKTTDSQRLMSATVYNTTGAAIAGPATLSSEDFAFVAGYNCPNGAKNKVSCTAIKLTFNPKNKAPGEYNATLDLGTISVPVKALVEAPAATNPEDVAANIVASLGTNINYGDMLSSGSTVIKTFTFKNNNTQAVSGNIDQSQIGTFYLAQDQCSGQSLTKGKTCQVKVSLNPAQLSGSQLGSVSYMGVKVDLSATVITPQLVQDSGEPAVVGGVSYAPNIQMLVNKLAVTNYIVPTELAVLTVIVKNSGNLATTTSSASVTGSGITVITNGCQNKALAPNQSCSVKLTVQPGAQGELSYNGSVLTITKAGENTVPSEPLSGLTFTLVSQKSGKREEVTTQTLTTESPLSVAYIGPHEMSGTVKIDYTSCSLPANTLFTLRVVHKTQEDNEITTVIGGAEGCLELKNIAGLLRPEHVYAKEIKAYVDYSIEGENYSLQSPNFLADYSFIKSYVSTQSGAATAWTGYSGVLTKTINFKVYKPRTFISGSIYSDTNSVNLTMNSSIKVLDYLESGESFLEDKDPAYWAMDFTVYPHVWFYEELELAIAQSVGGTPIKTYDDVIFTMIYSMYSEDGINNLAGGSVFGVNRPDSGFRHYPFFVTTQSPTAVSCRVENAVEVLDPIDSALVPSSSFDICSWDEASGIATIKWHNKNISPGTYSIQSYAMTGIISLELTGRLANYELVEFRGISDAFSF